MKKGPGKILSGEVEGGEFYRMAAKNARLDGVRRMFTFLMEEEELHRVAILEQIGRMAEGKPLRPVRKGSGKKGIRKFKSPLFTPDFVARGKQAEGEAAALSIGMRLEKSAILQFAAL